MKLSAILITKNEEVCLERCLSALHFADELIVLDSLSTDRTEEIARRHTEHFYQRAFTGFSDQRSAALSYASGEWILFVDADEVVSEELAKEIVEAVQSEKHDGYLIPRLTHFLGKPIRHCGWWPDYILRLVRRSSLRIPERTVHERLETTGSTSKLKHPFLHYSYRSFSDFYRKTQYYNLLDSQQKMAKGYRFRAGDFILRPPFTFFKSYVQKLGFLDGFRGFLLCTLMACGVAFRYAQLWDISRGMKDDESVEQGTTR